MNTEQRNEFFSQFTKHQLSLMNKKGNDYANEDTLSNFKISGAVANQNTAHPTEINVLNLIATKATRLGNLFSGNKSVMNESVEDSVVDLANYTFLLYCALREKSNERVEKTELEQIEL